MELHIKLGRIFGVKVGLHYSWIIIALLITFSLASRFRELHPDWGLKVVWATAIITGTLFFAAIVAHELSHALIETQSCVFRQVLEQGTPQSSMTEIAVNAEQYWLNSLPNGIS